MNNIRFEQMVDNSETMNGATVMRLKADIHPDFADMDLCFQYTKASDNRSFIGVFFIGYARQDLIIFNHSLDPYKNRRNVQAWLIGKAYPYLA